MKTTFKFLFFFLIFLLMGCKTDIKKTDLEILNEFLDGYSYDLSKEEFSFPSEINYLEKTIYLKWELANKDILDSSGKIVHKDEESKSLVTVEATLGNEKKSKVIGEIVSSAKVLTDEEKLDIINQYFKSLTLEKDITSEEIEKIKENPKTQTKFLNKELVLEYRLNQVLDKNIIEVLLSVSIDSVRLEKTYGIFTMAVEEDKFSDILTAFKENFKLEQNGDVGLNFIKEYEVLGEIVTLKWHYDKQYIRESGEFKHGDKTINTKVSLTLKYKDKEELIEIGEYTIKSAATVINEAKELISLPSSTNQDITLPKQIGCVFLEWYTDNEDVLSASGVCGYVEKDTVVTLTAFLSCGKSDIDIDYEITVKPFSNTKLLELALLEINIPTTVSSDIELKTEYKYNTKAIWTSSRTDIISNSGKVTLKDESVEVVLNLKLYIGEEFMEKNFTVNTVLVNKLNMHYFVERAKDFKQENMYNLKIEDGKVVLNDGEIYGYYESDIYETLAFDEMVGSWAATSSLYATCELLVKVRVNNEWSKYFTYGIWGLGRNNLYYNQTDKNAKMSVDEIIPTTGMGNAFQYRIILRRNNKETESPKLSLVATTFKIPNYKYEVDASSLASFVDYDVPKLNQNIVPEIGGSICSATTSTMLLKYKGFDFSSYDEFEHRYIANLVADRGHNSPTYGNWVYNTVTMGAYGLDSYVKHLYSWEELKYHLATVGPVGASIKGNAILYTTGGHLIVVRGYREVDGKTYVICNDPNINSRFGNDKDGNPYFVYYEFPLDVFMNFWRGTIYVVE